MTFLASPEFARTPSMYLSNTEYVCKYQSQKFSPLFQPGEAVSEKVLKSYCWMYSSFNIPRDFRGQCYRKNQSDNAVYNSYYQWVAIFLVFQAFLFYLPRVIWLMSEGGKSTITYLLLYLIHNLQFDKV